MARIDGRNDKELRPVSITTGFVDYAEGSALIRSEERRVGKECM